MVYIGKTIRHLLFGFAFLALFMFSLSAVSASNFVKVNGSEFILKGEPFYFAGANTYYLWYGSYNCDETHPNQGCSREVFNDAEKMNLSVLRVWGFSDGTGNYWGQLQPSAGVYSEAGFRRFDKMISKAEAKDLKLIIPLVNNWNDFGGMCQYVMWCNSSITSCSDTSAVHDRFYTGKCEKRLYKNYINYVLNRTNTITGIKYKNDPTVMAWELANEPRAKSDPRQRIVDNWIEEMSTYIKSLDSKHLVTVGMEGWSETYEGTDFIKNHNHTNIDFMAFHLIADNWGFDVTRSLEWINSHVEDAKVLGKPIILEEIGKQAGRASFLKQIYASIEANGEIDGDMVWMLKDRDYPDFDGYGINYPQDTSVIGRIIRHANFMSSRESPTIPENNTGCVVPTNGMNITKNTVLCSGEYFLPNGIKIAGSNINLKCNLTYLNGNLSLFSVGIMVQSNSNHILVEQCRINNYWSGISIGYNTDYVRIISNVIKNCSEYCFQADLSEWAGWISNYHLYKYNTAENCKYGFYAGSLRNSLYSDNEAVNNLRGFTSFYATPINTSFYSNLIMQNEEGISMDLRDGEIKNNTLIDNTYGIKLVGYSSVVISRNNFVDNTIQALEKDYSNSSWYLNGEGNYWSNYDETGEGCVDVDLNGICDSPYVIPGGNNIDNYPFTAVNGWLD